MDGDIVDILFNEINLSDRNIRSWHIRILFVPGEVIIGALDEYG